ncbi:MAG: FAD:protein FMN transferase [Burkholderiales bacterium]|nr:FAD:protein FMN transferase [Burkholderiales bacterium]
MLTAPAAPAQRSSFIARHLARHLTRPRGAWVQREDAAMGTAIRVELWSEDNRQGEAAAAAVLAEMHRIDRAMSPHKIGSELSLINREAPRRAVPLSEEMALLIGRALEYAQLSEGAFDISYAAVGQLYDYRRHQRPDAAALAAARECVGWRQLEFDRARGTLRFARAGMRIDLGGFAKGHAVDCAAALLRRRGIAHAWVSAGGDSRVIGDRRGRPWSVAIRDPRREGEAVAVLPLEDVSISTSGDYERYFDAEGQRCHHIIDPATGVSPQGVRSVTILAEDGLAAEAWSKTVFVHGVERGMALIAAQRGVDAVVVDGDGRLHASAELLHAGG